ncbi:hypothetical protein L0337_35825, partial [candidate division KSB1 bacterium]|nr:hypothetical protein [candidate division KSB1 bacterium]
MRRFNSARYLVMILFAFLVLPPSAFSLPAMNHTHKDQLTPSLYGPVGGFRLISAQRAYINNDLSMQFGFRFQYFGLDNMFAVGDDTARLIGLFSANFVPSPYFSTFVTWRATTSTDNNNAELIQQFADVNFGAKFGVDFADFFSVGAMFQVEYLDNAADLNLTSVAWNFLPMALFTFDLTRLETTLPFRFHGNIGYRIDNSTDLASSTVLTPEQRFFLRVYPDDHLLYGLGVEMPLDLVTFIGEYTSEQPLKGGFGSFADHPQRVTIGMRLYPTAEHEISLDGGADFQIAGQNNATIFLGEPDYNVIFGITYSFFPREAPPQAAAPESGRIAGIVLDETNANP